MINDLALDHYNETLEQFSDMTHGIIVDCVEKMGLLGENIRDEETDDVSTHNQVQIELNRLVISLMKDKCIKPNDSAQFIFDYLACLLGSLMSNNELSENQKLGIKAVMNTNLNDQFRQLLEDCFHELKSLY